MCGRTNKRRIPLHAVIVSGLRQDFASDAGRAGSQRYEHEQVRLSGPLQHG